MATTRSIIRGGLVLRPDRAAAAPADILVDGGTIAAIGPPGLAAPADAAPVDAAGFLLHPGLVNGHTHGHGHLSRGLTDDVTLETLLAGSRWFNGERGREDGYVSTAIGAAEMVLKGCTACFDLFLELPTVTADGMHAAAEAYRDVGMRAVLAPMVADRPVLDSIAGLAEALPAELREALGRWKGPDATELLARLREVAEGWPFDPDRIAFGLGPTIPLLCSDAFLRGCADLSRELGIPLQTHLSEAKTQELTAEVRYGTSLTRHLRDIGFLGPNVSAAHGVWLDDPDMAMLAEAGATVVLNAGSNLRLGSGLPHMRRLLDQGVAVAIGTDSSSCSDNQNMYEATRLASYASRVHSHDYREWVTSGEAALAATEGGARALGMPRIGRIAEGYEADIVFLDLNWIHWLPLRDALAQFVQAEDATAVRHVMIGGRWIVRDRALLTLDLASLRRRTEACVERLTRLGADNAHLFRRLQPIVGQYCAGLARTPFRTRRMAGCACSPPSQHR